MLIWAYSFFLAHCKYSCQIPGGSPKSSPESRWDGVSPRLYLDRSSMGANTEESHPTKRCSSALKQEWFSDQPGVWLCYSPSSNTGQRSLQMHNRATHASMPQVVKASLKGDSLYKFCDSLVTIAMATSYPEDSVSQSFSLTASPLHSFTVFQALRRDGPDVLFTAIHSAFMYSQHLSNQASLHLPLVVHCKEKHLWCMVDTHYILKAHAQRPVASFSHAPN